MRSIRQAPEQAAFDRREIPVKSGAEWADLPWYRLYRVEFPDQFYASTGSRLTPLSREFPCCYLGSTLETTVAEVWGDRLAAQRDLGGEIYVISAAQAKSWAFLKVESLPRDLRLCDLTDSDTRLATGLESGSLYCTDLQIPQTWAERIARHPDRFDGILYRSRHTDEPCLVLWSRPDSPSILPARLAFSPAGDFNESAAACLLAAKIGIRLSFSW